MTHEDFSLDRAESIANNVDPFGKKWVITKVSRGTSMFHAVPEPNTGNWRPPHEFAGMWTKIERLQTQIEKYLNRAWDEAEQAQKKLAGKQRQAKARTEEEAA